MKVNNLCPDDGNPLCAQPESEFFPVFNFLMLFFLRGAVGVVDYSRWGIEGLQGLLADNMLVYRRRRKLRPLYRRRCWPGNVW